MVGSDVRSTLIGTEVDSFVAEHARTCPRCCTHAVKIGMAFRDLRRAFQHIRRHPDSLKSKDRVVAMKAELVETRARALEHIDEHGSSQ